MKIARINLESVIGPSENGATVSSAGRKAVSTSERAGGGRRKVFGQRLEK